MSVLLTGATGFVGSAVLRRLLEEGHVVTAVVRSAEKAVVVEAAGATALIGDPSDIAFFSAAARESDGVIHTASPGDATSADFDDKTATGALEGLAGSGKPYVHTSGIWIYGSGAELTETSPLNPPALTAWRLPIEKRVREAEGVRTGIVAPGIVYGYGAGLPNVIVGAPRESSALRLIGDGSAHWTTVHVDDLAALYVLVFEQGAAGSYYMGVGGQNPTVRELTEAASRAAGLDGRVEAESDDDTRARLGAAFADALLLDQQATGSAARIDFGWEPNGPSLVDELATGSYAAVK